MMQLFRPSLVSNASGKLRRELYAGRRDPNAIVAQILPAIRILDRVEKLLAFN
jgi:hypothetical protein